MAFPEAGQIGGPVAHLEVDVRVIVAAPRWRRGNIPDALEIGGQAAGTRGADEQIAPKLENEGLEAGVNLALGITQEALVGGQFCHLRWCLAQIQ